MHELSDICRQGTRIHQPQPGGAQVYMFTCGVYESCYIHGSCEIYVYMLTENDESPNPQSTWHRWLIYIRSS